jgi:hypothetical protein
MSAIGRFALLPCERREIAYIMLKKSATAGNAAPTNASSTLAASLVNNSEGVLKIENEPDTARESRLLAGFSLALAGGYGSATLLMLGLLVFTGLITIWIILAQLVLGGLVFLLSYKLSHSANPKLIRLGGGLPSRL